MKNGLDERLVGIIPTRHNKNGYAMSNRENHRQPIFRWASCALLGGCIGLVFLLLGGVLAWFASHYISGYLVPAYPPTPSTPLALPTEITDAHNVPMRLVPAGTFIMGLPADDSRVAYCQRYLDFYRYHCERDWFATHEPQRTIYLDAFYMDKYEVTKALYKVCVAEGVCSTPKLSIPALAKYYYDTQNENHPMGEVNWEQANTYCRWRNARLPTEAEWEKAARGTDGRLYPWGNTFDGTYANFCDKNCLSLATADKNSDDGYAHTAPVGSYPADVSPYGIYDLAGNVSEWVNDWFSDDYYATAPASNPGGPNMLSSNGDRVLRGGSYSGAPYHLLVPLRDWRGPDMIYLGLGFRCARPARR